WSRFLLGAAGGSDISSATTGSSVARVAGKNRWPAKPWANAPPAVLHRSAALAINANFFMFFSSSGHPRIGPGAFFWLHARGKTRGRGRASYSGRFQERTGGARGGAVG